MTGVQTCALPISTKVFALRMRPYEMRRTNHCLFRKGTYSTDTPFLISSEVEGVQEVSPALGHDEPVSVGCPLYNEAFALGGWLVVSSNVFVQRLD